MTTPDPSAVREWARGNGYRVSSRGRIAAEVVAAYGAAQQELAALAGDFRSLAADFAELRGVLGTVTDSAAGLTGRIAGLEAAAAARPERRRSLRPR